MALLFENSVTVNRPGLDPNAVLLHFVAEDKGFISLTPETLIIRSSPVDSGCGLLSMSSEHDREKLYGCWTQRERISFRLLLPDRRYG